MNPFGIKTEVECNGNEWTTGCTYRIPAIPCTGMSTFEQLKQSVEKAKAVLNAEAVVSRDTRNYFSASFSALPNMGMGMNFPTSTSSHHHHHHQSPSSGSDRNGTGGLILGSSCNNDIGSSRGGDLGLIMNDLNQQLSTNTTSSVHHHHNSHNNSNNSINDERIFGGGRGIADGSLEKRHGTNNSNSTGKLKV